MKQPIRVLIVDDHPVVREGVAAVLERERDIQVVGSAEAIEAALRVAAKVKPEVILLDLRLPGDPATSGVTICARGLCRRRLHGTRLQRRTCFRRCAAAREAIC